MLSVSVLRACGMCSDHEVSVFPHVKQTCAFCLHVFSLFFHPSSSGSGSPPGTAPLSHHAFPPTAFPFSPPATCSSFPAPPPSRVYHHFALERSSTSPPSPWKQWHNSRLAATAAWGRGVLTILCSCAVARWGLWHLSQIYESRRLRWFKLVNTTIQHKQVVSLR